MLVQQGLIFTSTHKHLGFIVLELRKGFIIIQPFDSQCCYKTVDSHGNQWIVPHEDLTNTSIWVLNEEPEDWFPEDLLKDLLRIPTKGIQNVN